MFALNKIVSTLSRQLITPINKKKGALNTPIDKIRILLSEKFTQKVYRSGIAIKQFKRFARS